MCLLVLAFFGVLWWLNLKPEALIYLLQHNGRRLLGEGCLFSVFKIMQSVRKKSVHVSLKRVKYNGKRNCYSSWLKRTAKQLQQNWRRIIRSKELRADVDIIVERLTHWRLFLICNEVLSEQLNEDEPGLISMYMCSNGDITEIG